MKRGSFTVPLYGITIYIRIGKTSESIKTAANRMIKSYQEELIDCPIEGLVFTPDSNRSIQYIYLSEEHLSINTITHETDHLRNNIMEQCSLQNESDAGETSAYLNGYINEKVFQFINQHGLKIKYTNG